MKVCVFVDGESFRHSIVELFPQFHQEDYLPKFADWTALYNWLVSTAVKSGERIRTYWYMIEHIDFFPYHFPNPLTSPTELKNLLCKHEPYKNELDTLAPTTCAPRMTQMVEDLRQRQITMQKRFDGWRAIQDGIAMKHEAIEFRRAGAMKCNLFENSLGKEKAVDVKLASDMIILKDIYDAAVIVSGDQDYVPAVQVVKDFGKRVVNVAFLTRGGEVLPGGARRLSQKTDWSYNIPYNVLTSYLKIR
jgi:uncharacterized LabA/DUF88 family protein